MIRCKCEVVGKFGKFTRLCPMHNQTAAEELRDDLLKQMQWRGYIFRSVEKIAMSLTHDAHKPENQGRFDSAYKQLLLPLQLEHKEIEEIIAIFKAH